MKKYNISDLKTNSFSKYTIRATTIKRHLLELKKTFWNNSPYSPGVIVNLKSWLLSNSEAFWRKIGCKRPSKVEASLIAITFVHSKIKELDEYELRRLGNFDELASLRHERKDVPMICVERTDT